MECPIAARKLKCYLDLERAMGEDNFYPNHPKYGSARKHKFHLNRSRAARKLDRPKAPRELNPRTPRIDPLRLQTKKIEEGWKVDRVIDINGQDPSGSQTKKFQNQFFVKKFEDLNNSSIKSRTIVKVNVWLRESNPDAYTPKMVSIGPYHKENPQLHPMEEYKLLYLQRFLGRKEGLDVESCINKLEGLKEEVLSHYEDIKNLDTNKFYHMLLLDGCFVVEFIRECLGIYPLQDARIIEINHHYILRDLMLLENQLPFVVLNKLYNMTKGDYRISLEILVFSLFPFCVDLPKKSRYSFVEKGECSDINHLLHLVHKFSCHRNREKKSENKDNTMWQTLVQKLSCHGNRKKKSEMEHATELSESEMEHATELSESETGYLMPNATELSEAGVSFHKFTSSQVHNINKNNFTSLFDIKFENGSMTIPCFKVKDNTETLLRNLIAYEQQSCYGYHTYFSDFATFMDNLIDSDKDVNLLRREGIIQNWIGEDKEVADLFNKIGKGVTVFSDFYYKEEVSKACQHCNKRWNKIKANLKHNYFSSPWVGASTVAAIVLLILTFMQTILAFIGPVKK